MFFSLTRYSTTSQSSLGTLHLDGCFACYALEDTKRLVKKDGETRITDGRYGLALRTGSPMAGRYAEKYSWHKYGMIWLQDVPRFKWVYMHPGNTAEDTRGCLLLGNGPNNNQLQAAHLSSSLRDYQRIYENAAPRLSGGEKGQIRIVNFA